MEQEKQKLGFFDQIIYSVQPSKYGRLLKQKRRSVIFYTIFLMFCLAVMNFVVPVAGFFSSVGGYDQFVTEGLPDVELKDGMLQVENRIEMGKNSPSYILVDTSIERAKVEDINKEDHLAEILVTKNNMIVYNGGWQTVELDFAQLKGLSLNNESLLNLKGFVYVMLFFSFLTSMISQAATYLFQAAFVAILCWGPFTIRGAKRRSYGSVFAAAIYAKTVPEIVMAFNNSAGWISNTYLLSYVAIGAAVCILMSALRKTSERKTA